MLLPTLFAIILVFSLILAASAVGVSANTHVPDDHSIIASIDSSSPSSVMALNTLRGQAMPMVAAGYSHTVGLKADGTVVAVGENYYGQCDVGGWTDIIQVTVGYDRTVGIKSDGTVVAVGNNAFGKCDVGAWTNIIQVATGYDHTVGLKTDGTVVAVGSSDVGRCDVGDWTDIVEVTAGYGHTVGLKSDLAHSGA